MEESGDRYSRSEIHRHLGFYYLIEEIRPKEAVRQRDMTILQVRGA